MSIFVTLLWTRSSKSMPLLHWGHRAGCSTSGGVSQKRSRGGESTSLRGDSGHVSFYATQDMTGFLGCKSTLPAAIQFFV